MADILNRLEDELEAAYDHTREHLAVRYSITSWEDYHFFLGYLQSIRDIGAMIKKLRNPAAPAETGEIPNILEENTNG